MFKHEVRAVPVMKAVDVAYVRFSAPDLQVMEDFLIGFGMQRAAKTDAQLHMRGYGQAPYVHVTEIGAPAFIGLGLFAPDEASLHRLAEHDGTVVEANDAPGGGSIVRLRDPDGVVVEVVAGQSAASPLPLPSSAPRNEAGRTDRQGQPRRVKQGPSHVMRLGHVVMGVSSFARSEAWYKERFGLLTSDAILSDEGVADAAFLRCDRGDVPVDHHTVVLSENPNGREFMHSAYEVFDFDDLMAGHMHLEGQTRQHQWGIGRHLIGSQIFDYWRDPWGHEIEHWTDGDRYTADVPPGTGTLADATSVQWGRPMP